MTKFNWSGVVALGASAAVCLPLAIATPLILPLAPAQAKESKKDKDAKPPQAPIEIFADLNVPLSLQLKALDPTWKRLILNKNAADASPYFLFGFSGLVESALGTNIYYTQGKTIVINEQPYLVTYRAEDSYLKFSELIKSGSSSLESLKKALTPESRLVLSLFNLNTIDSLGDIQPFDLQREIEASNPVPPPEPQQPATPSTTAPESSQAP
jgi:hypothetical protein